MNRKYKILIFLSIIVFAGFMFNDVALADTYQNYDKANFVSCGPDSMRYNYYVTKIPKIIPKTTSTVYTIIQIAVPILLVIFGMIDMVKGITSQKEDEIKKGQNLLIKRLLYGALIFFIFVIVKFIISLAADSSGRHSIGRIMDCAECFIENNDKCVRSAL